MEREQTTEARRPTSRTKTKRATPPLMPIVNADLEEVWGGGGPDGVEDIKPGDSKKASGAYAITIPPEQPSAEEQKEQGEAPAEN